MEATAPTISFPAQTSCLNRIRTFCKKILENHFQDQQIHRRIVLAVDEAVANIIEHACIDNGGNIITTIELSITTSPDQVVVRILDRGVAFNSWSDQSQLPQGTRTRTEKLRSLSSFSQRGFGLQLIRLIMDEINYQRTPQGENLLTLTKRLRRGDKNERS